MKILYVSGSLGLGHITRDLAIATALRSREPDIDIWWLAGEPARSMLQHAGEQLHPAGQRVPERHACRRERRLADAIARHLGASVSYPPLPADGAGRVADIVLRQAGAATGLARSGQAIRTQ